MTNVEYANGLRHIADFYEAHPDMPLPADKMYLFLSTREEFLRGVRVLASGGKVTKSCDPETSSYPYYKASRAFGALTVELNIPKTTVCRLVSRWSDHSSRGLR